jgi:hypothetical protein
VKITYSKLMLLPVEDQYVLVDIDAPPPVMQGMLQSEL